MPLNGWNEPNPPVPQHGAIMLCGLEIAKRVKADIKPFEDEYKTAAAAALARNPKYREVWYWWTVDAAGNAIRITTDPSNEPPLQLPPNTKFTEGVGYYKRRAAKHTRPRRGGLVRKIAVSSKIGYFAELRLRGGTTQP
jgi:hypothetical protein